MVGIVDSSSSSTFTSFSFQVSEISLPCADGIQLAAQYYTTQTSSDHNNNNNNIKKRKQRILCLHGWMDNCRSFHYLAPYLMTHGPSSIQQQQQLDFNNNLNQEFEVDLEVVALDFPGHGHSSHKSLDGPPTLLAESAFYVAEAVRQLQWQPDPDNNNKNNIDDVDNNNNNTFAIIGHSMGAAVACLYAAAFPEQVNKLVLLDGAGPLARKTEDIAKHVRHHVQRRQLAMANTNKKPPRIYPSLEMAIRTRCQTARNFPGNQWLSEAAAREMVTWGTLAAVTDNNDADNNNNGSGGVQFRHDPRLQWPSLQYFTQEQTNALYRDVQCPTALFTAQDGWPFDEERMNETVVTYLLPVVNKRLPGSHHFHADPETAELVAKEVLQFLVT